MPDQKIILNTDPQSARLLTAQDLESKTLWISRRGNIFYDEQLARRDGSTHFTCPLSGEVVPHGCLSRVQRIARERSRWESAKQVPLAEAAKNGWRVFIDEEKIAECDLKSIVEEMLVYDVDVSCVPDLELYYGLPKYPEIDEGDLLDEAPEGCDEFSDEVRDLIKTLNEKMREEVTWWEGSWDTRVSDADMAAIRKAYEKEFLDG